MAAAIVNFNTYSDADFAKVFRLTYGDDYVDFTGMTMQMMVRKQPEDVEVFITLSTDFNDGIVLSEGADTPGQLTMINIIIRREQLAELPEGDYVHSLIMLRPDGFYDDIWRGTLTHHIGPTR